MPFKVQVGPPQIAIHQGLTVLVSEPDGQINWPSDDPESSAWVMGSSDGIRISRAPAMTRLSWRLSRYISN
jgi:hypothetical protein